MNLFASSTIMTLLMLTLPIMMTSTQTYKSKSYPQYVKTTISYTFMISLITMMMFLYSGKEMIISDWHWITIQTLKLSLSFKLDYFSMIFIPVALFVTWSIMEFSMWYMHSDPYINRFF